MSAREVSALSEGLLVVKGAAQPLRLPTRTARQTPLDGRRRVSIRLDEAQHRRLRLAAAHLRKSVHAVLLDALEHYLDRIVPGSADPSCACLVRRPADSVTVMPFRAP